MAKPQHPDHAGRMPGHPRYGNPSDEGEEAARIGKAFQNMEDWKERNGGFSGGVTMQYGNGPVYQVGIGQPEIAQKIVSRPIAPPVETKALPEPAKAVLPPPLPSVQPDVSEPLIKRITGWIWKTISGDRP